MLRSDRKQQNSVKQLSFNKKKERKKRDVSDISCLLKFARCMARWMDGYMDEWVCGWMCTWIMDGCTDG